jgi:hypothetical protein
LTAHGSLVTNFPAGSTALYRFGDQEVPISVEETSKAMRSYLDAQVARGDFADDFTGDVSWTTVGGGQNLHGRGPAGLSHLDAYSSLRRSVGLRVKRVDLLHQRITVAEQVTEIDGHFTWGPPKTEAGRRTVTLPAVTAAALAEPRCPPRTLA